MPPEDPFPGLPKTFAEQYFWSLDVDDRDPLPKEVRFLELLTGQEGALPHLRDLVRELVVASERRVPDPDLWNFMNAAARQLKLAQEYAQRKLDYFNQREALEDAEARRVLAEQHRVELDKWLKERG